MTPPTVLPSEQPLNAPADGDSQASSTGLSARRRWLGIAVVVTAALTWWASTTDDDPGLGPHDSSSSTRATHVTGSGSAGVARPVAPPPLRRQAVASWPALPLSGPPSWGPPSVPAAPVAVVAPPPPPPPAPPQAPAFGYQWIGRLDDAGVAQALLAGPHRTLAVKAGQLIDGQWRLEAIEPAMLRLTWLPGNLPLNVTYKPS